MRDRIDTLTVLARYFARLGWSLGVALVRPESFVRTTSRGG